MPEQVTIKISTEFTDTPGARDISDGQFSGEAFFNELLKPRFEEATSDSKKLFIDFDDTWGYASSFISGAFGRLAAEFGLVVRDILVVKSEDDPTITEKIEKEFKKVLN